MCTVGQLALLKTDLENLEDIEDIEDFKGFEDDFMFVFSPPGKRSGLGMDLCSQFFIIPKQHGDA